MLHEEWYEDFDEEEHSHVQQWGPGPFRRGCAFCKGTGVHPATMNLLAHNKCSVCQGLGLQEFKGREKDYNPCGTCDGSGQEPGSTPASPCHTCGGRGLI